MKQINLLKTTTILFLGIANFAQAQIWEGDVSSNWNDQNNWSGNIFPYGQNVIIDKANYTNAPIMAAASSFGVQDITVQGSGTVLTFNDNTSISGRGIIVQTGAVFNSGATINMYQDLTITGAGTQVILSSGSIGGRDIFVNSGALFTNNGTALTAWRDLVINGATTEVTFNGGSRAGRDVLVQDGALFTNNGGTFTNHNIVSVSGAGSIINFSDGSFACAILNVDSGTIFNMTGGIGTFNNDVIINSGTLNVNGNSAVINISDDLMLIGELSYFNLYNGDVNIGDDLYLSGDACNCNTVNANIYGGELLIDGALNVYTKNASSVDYPSLSINNGTVDIDEVIKTGASGGGQLINIDGGSVNFRADFTLSEGDTINQTDGEVSIQGTFTNNGMVYNVSGGKIMYDGDGYNTLNGSGITEFYDLEVNDAAGIEIAAPIYVRNKLSLKNGRVAVSAGGSITLRDGAVIEHGSDSSYIIGKLTKEGDDAFVFHVGDYHKYAPIAISSPASYTKYTASYLSYGGANINLKDDSINNVSSAEHWILNRDSGNADVFVTLHWLDGDTSGINDPTEIVVAEYDGAQWKSLGRSGNTGTRYAGTLTSAQTASEYNQYTFASNSNTVNPLPVECYTLMQKQITV